ncbi:MAG: type II/IV secretion system ATPase subunit [Candidatus Pacearchaeota archaeon]|jgi:type IV secretory pathway ATPase VirB11/archaellum biosynthesis ATPase
MLFKSNTKLYDYEIVKEEGNQVVYVNYLGASFVPNLADNPDVMSRTIDLLTDSSNISRIVFVQQRNYSYGTNETFFLQEIANLHVYLLKQEEVLSPNKLSISGSPYLAQRYNDMSYLIMLIKRDIVACYQELERFITQEKSNLEKIEENLKIDQITYIRLLEKIKSFLDNLKIINESKNYFSDYSFGSREIYNKFFRPDIIPNFTFTRLMASIPPGAEMISQYEIGKGYDKSLVTILKRPEDAKFIYHIMPPEYSLDENKQSLLNLARNVLIEHQPKTEDYTDPERVRQSFFNIALGLLRDLAKTKKIDLNYGDLNMLATILVRVTIGFGLIEVLLQDSNIQDIVMNSPPATNPIYLRHQEYEECMTNIIPSKEDSDSWAAKLRMISARPLDESMPVLDADLNFGSVSARVAAIQRPLSVDGLAYAFRRHREDPWTLPLFIKNKMINSLAAGLFSFIIDGSRTILIAGTRSSGKTSLLGSLMLEIMPKYRIIVIEDTPELPVEAIRKLNYDILRMKVRSSLTNSGNELGADEGIRTSLRLGDSSLIVGEVRSLEAKALYEAMRVGALANVVAGTIHGASPYGVFDRVVNDLGVPVTSFKATDCIIVSNPIKSPDGLKSVKRVLQLTEVRKHWTKDPEEEGGFVNLLKYNIETDILEPTEELINGDSEIIKNIASGVKGWAGDWDAVYDNILLRAKIKQELLDTSVKLKKPILLESKFNSLCNNMFHQFSKVVQEDVGLPVSEKVFPLWQDWLREQVKTNRYG